MTDPVKQNEAPDGGRQALLKATVRVVARLGMRGLTHRAVAQEAGVAHGLVTHHFGTREALITAAFREDARTRETAATLNPGTGDIADIGGMISTVVQTDPEEERYQYEMVLEALRRPELIEDVRQIYRSFTDALERELELIGAERADSLSRVVFAALDGLILQQLIFGDSAETDDAVERLHSLIRADVAVSRMDRASNAPDQRQPTTPIPSPLDRSTPMNEVRAPRGRIDDSLWIDNERVVAHGEHLTPVDDSASEEVIAEVRAATNDDVERAFSSAAAAQRPWARVDPEERIAVVRRAADILEAASEDLADSLMSEVGTVARQVHATQLKFGFDAMRLAADAAAQLLSQDAGGSSVVVREAAGLVAAITPWNYPIFQVALKVAPAVLAGCATVLKPPGAAPLTAFAIAQAFAEAGLPPGVLNIVSGPGAEIGARLAGHPRADFVSFTGSVSAGRQVAVAAARNGTRNAMELGGKSAAVVVDESLVEAAVRATYASATANAGQTCAALTRLIVPESSLALAEEIAASLVAAEVVGDPRDPATTIGPLATRGQRDSVTAMIERARATAGVRTIAVGSDGGRDTGWFAPPAVFTASDPSVEIVQEEVFGPVLVIQPARDVEHALELADDSRFGLIARVWTDDSVEFERIARRLRVGGVIQSGRITDWAAPFGGVKESGYGRERGSYGVEEYLVPKSIQREVLA